MIAPAKNRLLNILLADDGSINIRPAIQLLADLPHDSSTEITALRAFTPIEGSEFARVEEESEKTRNLLKSRHFHFHSIMIQGYPTEMILKYAGEHSPDLIVMGGKAAGMLGGLLGNVAANVVHSGHWPVLIVRGPYKGIKHVLLVTDGSLSSHYTCEFLGGFPLPEEAEIDIMHVAIPVRAAYPVEPAGLALPTITPEDEARLNKEHVLRGQEIVEDAQARLMGRWPTRLVVQIGEPLDEILRYVKTEDIDMLICGSRGAANLTGWLMGSLSRDLARQAACSVLVVRTPPEKT